MSLSFSGVAAAVAVEVIEPALEYVRSRWVCGRKSDEIWLGEGKGGASGGSV